MEETKKGKNFSKNNQGQRRAGDFYQTPYSMTEHLVERLRGVRIKSVCEPACGKEAIISVLAKYPKQFPFIHAYDIAIHGLDFMKEPRRFEWIITNPPFTLSTEFIRKSQEVATKGFALLMPIEYLHGKERYEEFYKDAKGYPLTRVLIFTRRAMLTDEVREDGKYDTGMITWCWYIWERKPLHRGPSRPVIEWIDNDADVLRKGKTRKNTRQTKEEVLV